MYSLVRICCSTRLTQQTSTKTVLIVQVAADKRETTTKALIAPIYDTRRTATNTVVAVRVFSSASVNDKLARTRFHDAANAHCFVNVTLCLLSKQDTGRDNTKTGVYSTPEKSKCRPVSNFVYVKTLPATAEQVASGGGRLGIEHVLNASQGRDGTLALVSGTLTVLPCVLFVAGGGVGGAEGGGCR